MRWKGGVGVGSVASSPCQRRRGRRSGRSERLCCQFVSALAETRILNRRPHLRRQPFRSSVGMPVGMGVDDGRCMTDWTGPEYATVGSLLLEPAELRQVSGWLRPEDFANSLCAEVYGLIMRMTGDGIPVDPVTVRDQLRRAGRIRRDGWPAMELVRMVESTPSPVSVGYYGRLVVERALYRRVEQAGTRLVQVGRAGRGEVDDVFGMLRDECTELLAVRRRYADAVAVRHGRGGPTPIASLLRTPEPAQPAGRAVEG